MEEVVLEGLLERKSNQLLKKWQQRHFSLTRHSLVYRKKKDEDPPLGSILLSQVEGVKLVPGSNSKRVVFEVRIQGRVETLAADSEQTAQRWADALIRGRSQQQQSQPQLSQLSTSSLAALSPMSNRSTASSQATSPLSTSTRLKSSDTLDLSSSSGSWSIGTPAGTYGVGLALLQGEQVLWSTEGDDVFFSYGSVRFCQEARLRLTNYRLMLTPKLKKKKIENLPLTAIMKSVMARMEERNLTGLAITAKDFRTLMIFFSSAEHFRAFSTLFKMHSPPKSIFDCFAYKPQEQNPIEPNAGGFYLFDVTAEMLRQRVSTNQWRVTNVNSDFRFPRFPNQFIVPDAITDDALNHLWKSQIKWRRWTLAFCWKSQQGACLLRSSKVLVSEEKKGSTSDFEGERAPKQSKDAKKYRSMLQQLLVLHKGAEAVQIYHTSSSGKKKGSRTGDQARNTIRSPLVTPTSAGAPRQKKIETEEGIVMINKPPLLQVASVEESLNKLAAAIASFDPHILIKSQDNANEWRRMVSSAAWLTGISQLLSVAEGVIGHLLAGNPVVVINHFGGDAVPQITSLTQICMDPYFRTIKGFCTLVEKEFLAFGFSWGIQNKGKFLPPQYSAMFIQFIDAVWQLWMQWYTHFEFNTSLLLFLLDSTCNCRFSTFLASSQKERLKGNLDIGKSASIWPYIMAHREDFLNPSFDSNATKSMPRIIINPLQVTLWTEYYMRWHGPNKLSSQQVKAAIADIDVDQTGLSLVLDNMALCAVPSAGLEEIPPLASLSMANNFISSVSTAMRYISDLQSLDISHNLLVSLSGQSDFTMNDAGQAVSPFFRLEQLNMSYNRLCNIDLLPITLTELDIANNFIEKLPKNFTTLTNLQVLNISRNKLVNSNGDRTIPEVVLQLTSLKSLIVAGNNFPELPSDLFSLLSGLEELDVSHNLLTKLPEGIANCSKLRVLNISANTLSSLPSDIGNLSSLRELHARNSLSPPPIRVDPSLEQLHPLLALASLKQLRFLDFRNNSLTLLPPNCFGQWESLETLLLSHNQIPTLPPEITNLAPTLEELDLTHNKIEILPAEMAKLTRLRKLSVEQNAITELPAQLGNLTQLEVLEVGTQNGRLRSPPMEVVALGSGSIVAYLGQLLKGQEPCYRLKLMFVGQENVGKTSLLRALQRKGVRLRKDMMSGRTSSFDHTISPTHSAPLSTDGIEINTWGLQMDSVWGSDAPVVELSAWDFAGQEIYYSTHQFFLSERSLFLVIFNLVALVQSRVEYWLQSVRIAAKDSPVLIIGTHVEHELCTEDFLTDMKQKIEKRVRQKYPNVVGTHFVSPVTGKGMDQLLTNIRQIVAKQDYVGRPMPSSYLALEKAVQMQAKARMPPILSWREYSELAYLSRIEEEGDDLRTATALLHNLGSLVHFSNEEKLRDVVILDPQWLMDVMSTVVSTKHNFCRDGVIMHSALPQIWRPPAYPLELHDFLLSLLERFEITFPVHSHAYKLGIPPGAAEEQASLLPSLLPEEKPAKLAQLWPNFLRAQENVFGRYYRFDFIPMGFLGRLMIRLLAFPLAAQVYWRNGILARIAKEQILVELEPEKETLKLLVRTELQGEQMSNLCWLVFAAVDSLIKEWYNLETRLLVPCPHCMVFRGLDQQPYLFDFIECQQAATNPNDAFLFCRINESKSMDATAVRLDLAAPDLAMVHLDSHKIAYVELEKEESPIGEGGFATVYKGTYKGQVVAIKQLKLGSDPLNETPAEAEARRLSYEEFRHEVWIMSGLSHPNLVALLGFCAQPPCIVTEFVPNGSLDKFIQSDDSKTLLDWPLRLKIAKDIAKGCAFLHSTSPPVMHRDLKSPNILLVDLSPESELVAKVCDFGVSLSAAHATTGRRVDCPVWLAPEVMANKVYTEKADVYSIGVILWEILTRKAFFGEVSFMTILEDKVKAGERPEISTDCPQSYRMLIEDCWAQEPEKRPTSSEIVKRLEAIMEELCPQSRNYDAEVEAKHRAKREAQIESKARAQQLTQEKRTRLNRTTRKTAALTQGLAASAQSDKFSQALKIAIAEDCNKKDIAKYMEEFLKQRFHTLEQEDSTDTRALGGSAVLPTRESIENMEERKKQRAEEKKWIEEYLKNLNEERERMKTQEQEEEQPKKRRKGKKKINSDDEGDGEKEGGEDTGKERRRSKKSTGSNIKTKKKGSSKKKKKEKVEEGEGKAEGTEQENPESEQIEESQGPEYNTDVDSEHPPGSAEQNDNLHSGSLELLTVKEPRQSSPADMRRAVFGDGQPLFTKFEANRHEVNALCMLPNGLVASACDSSIILVWDPTKPKGNPGKIKTRSKAVWSLQVVMRKTTMCLASGSWDGAIYLWAVKNGKPQGTFTGHKDAVFRLAVLPDGVLVSASWDSAIKLWDPYSGTCLATLTGHRGKVRALAVLSDGRIASAGDDQVIRIWEGEANRGDMRCVKQLQGHTKAIESLAVLLDGRLVSASQDATLRMWDVDKETCVKTLQGHKGTVRTVHALPGGFFASGSADKAIRIWHVSGSLVHSIENAHAKDVVCMGVLPSGKLVTGGWDKVIKLWNFPARP